MVIFYWRNNRNIRRRRLRGGRNEQEMFAIAVAELQDIDLSARTVHDKVHREMPTLEALPEYPLKTLIEATQVGSALASTLLHEERTALRARRRRRWPRRRHNDAPEDEYVKWGDRTFAQRRDAIYALAPEIREALERREHEHNIQPEGFADGGALVELVVDYLLTNEDLRETQVKMREIEKAAIRVRRAGAASDALARTARKFKPSLSISRQDVPGMRRGNPPQRFSNPS